jgi:transposase
MDDLVTVDEAAAIAGVNRVTIYRAIKGGALKRGGALLPRADVDAWRRRREDERAAAWIEFDCDGCGKSQRRRRCWQNPSASGLRFCAVCARNGVANTTRVASRVHRRRLRVAELYRAGAPIADIASELGVSESQVHQDRATLEIALRPPRRKHPPAEPRVCAHPGCNVLFVPDTHHVALGHGDYCSRECAAPARLRGAAKGHEKRHGHTGMYGRHAKILAALKARERVDSKRPGNRVGRPSDVLDDPEIVRQINELRAKSRSQTQIAISVSHKFGVSVSRDQVKRVLADRRKLGETPL